MNQVFFSSFDLNCDKIEVNEFFTMNDKTEVNMTIGIDKIGFATSQYVLKLQDLAEARGIDPRKIKQRTLTQGIEYCAPN